MISKPPNLTAGTLKHLYVGETHIQSISLRVSILSRLPSPTSLIRIVTSEHYFRHHEQAHRPHLRRW